MKTKIFTKNNKGKIEFTEKQLKDLLDEIYDEGYNDGSKRYYYTTPYYYRYPYYNYYGSTTPITYCTTTASTSSNNITTATNTGGITISAADWHKGETTACINDECSDKKKSTYKYTVKTRD